MDEQIAADFKYPETIRKRWVHPYLLFSKDQVPALRAKMKQPAFRADFEVLAKQADHDLIFPLAGQPRPREGGGQPDRGARGFLAIVARTAYMHLITQEQKYLDRCMAEIEASASTPWEDQAADRSNEIAGVWFAQLGMGERSQSLAFAYDWLYDALSDSQRKLILELTQKRILEPYYKAGRRGEWSLREYMNWNSVVNGNVGLLCLATLNDLPDAHHALKNARWLLPRNYDKYGRDGGWDEGGMYTRYNVRMGAIFLLALRNTFGDDDGFIEKFRDVGYYMKTLMWQDALGRDRQFRFRDSNPFGGGINAQLLEMFPENSDYLRMHDRDIEDPPVYVGPEKVQTKRHDYSFWSFDALIHRPDVPLDTAEPELPEYKLFRDTGVFVYRGDDLKFCALGIETGANHLQFDMGSFELVYKGEHLITDMNYGDKESIQHNCLTVNGCGQVFRMKANMLGVDTDRAQSFQAVTVQFPSLYGPALKHYRRHFMILRGRLVVVVDEVDAIEPVELGTRFTTYKDIELSADEALVMGETQDLRIVPHPASGGVTFARHETESARPVEGEHYLQVHSTLNDKTERAVWTHLLLPDAHGAHELKVDFGDKKDPLKFSVTYADGKTDEVLGITTDHGTVAWQVT